MSTLDISMNGKAVGEASFTAAEKKEARHDSDETLPNHL
jgi:hypothetical protein